MSAFSGWGRAAQRALWSGSLASLASTAVLAWRGRHDAGSAAAPVNAVSHWFYGERATRRDGASLAMTLPGLLTHHGASILWAIVYERWIARPAWRDAPRALPAAGTALLAATVDYSITPPRFTPGFEKRLSLRSLALVYAAVALGLAVARPRARAANRLGVAARRPEPPRATRAPGLPPRRVESFTE